MKFDAKRHNLHPVLTPTNDDYPDASLTVAVSDPAAINGKACFTIEFNLSEPSIAGLIKNARALCKAMIYCRGTLFREDLQAPDGEFIIQAELPMDQLMGTVEIHPFIVSTDRVEFAPDRLHPEYKEQKAYLSVDQRHPLAAANRHEFEVMAEENSIDALVIFESDPDNHLPPGQYDIRLLPSERQIVIVVNESDYEQLMTLRAQKTFALASIYTSALVHAFAFLEFNDDVDDPSTNGWFQYLKTRRDPNLTAFRMAQAVFDQPFQKLVASIPQ